MVSGFRRALCGRQTRVGGFLCGDRSRAGKRATLGGLRRGIAGNGCQPCRWRSCQSSGGRLAGLADMPVLPVAAISGVRNALQAGAVLASPVFKDRRGHPVGFAASYRAELLALQGDAGARSLLERDLSRLLLIEINHQGIFADIDRQQDLQLFNLKTSLYPQITQLLNT